LAPEPLEPAYRSVTNAVGLQAFQLPIAVTHIVASGVTVVAVVVGALSLVVRFRRARGTERQQLRWVALAAVLASLAILVVLAGMVVGNAAVLIWAAGISFAVLPLAIGAAVARYRLYDLDRIISRTLAYGLLTVLLGGGYAAVVLGLGQLLGRSSSLAVAGATLAVAALFQPVRRRVQQAVDRRFNRRRYDAARTIAAFSTRLREELDLDTLTGELLTVVEQTMQPTQASLWLRPHSP
jgi:peptidoglycan/LPS O-acetylase OafA/YrhL